MTGLRYCVGGRGRLFQELLHATEQQHPMVLHQNRVGAAAEDAETSPGCPRPRPVSARCISHTARTADLVYDNTVRRL